MGKEEEIELVTRKLDKINKEIAEGKRRLLTSEEALGKYAKYLKNNIYGHSNLQWTQLDKIFWKTWTHTQIRVVRKIAKILKYPRKRHLHIPVFFVVEIGQYRLTYRVFEETGEVRFYFVGTHKEYEKWCREQFWNSSTATYKSF